MVDSQDGQGPEYEDVAKKKVRGKKQYKQILWRAAWPAFERLERRYSQVQILSAAVLLLDGLEADAREAAMDRMAKAEKKLLGDAPPSIVQYYESQLIRVAFVATEAGRKRLSALCAQIAADPMLDEDERIALTESASRMQELRDSRSGGTPPQNHPTGHPRGPE